MNPWDIDPNPVLPIYRALYRRLRLAFQGLLRRRPSSAAALQATCREKRHA